MLQEKEKEEEGLFKSPKSETPLFISLTHKLFPEECVAELEAFSRQLHSSNKPRWLINMIVLGSYLELIFALYIQIKVENIFLPNKNNQKNEK